jgi:hypothetical protein
VRSNKNEYLTHLAEFILFLTLSLSVWAGGELCRYLIFHAKPTGHQFFWGAAIFTTLWIAAGLIRDYTPPLYRRISSIEVKQLSIEQQPEA